MSPTGPMVTRNTGRLFQLKLVKVSWEKESKKKAMIENNFCISSQLHQTHWSNGHDGHIVHDNVHVDVHDNVHDDVLEDVHGNVNKNVHDNVHNKKFSMTSFLDAIASLRLTYVRFLIPLFKN